MQFQQTYSLGPSRVLFRILFQCTYVCEFRAILGISVRFSGDFRCPRAPEIHIFCLKSQFFALNPNYRENHMGRPQVSLLLRQVSVYLADFIAYLVLSAVEIILVFALLAGVDIF